MDDGNVFAPQPPRRASYSNCNQRHSFVVRFQGLYIQIERSAVHCFATALGINHLQLYIWTCHRQSASIILTSLSATMPICDFSSPAFANGHIYFALARKDDTNRNQYMLALARGYGMAATRKGATLNSSTSSADAPALSSSGHPLIWFDADWELDPNESTFPEGGLLDALLAAEPPVIRATGRTRTQHTKRGGEREIPQVEILLGEDELAHVCSYCGDVELPEGDRWQRRNDDASNPAYCCTKVS